MDQKAKTPGTVGADTGREVRCASHIFQTEMVAAGADKWRQHQAHVHFNKAVLAIAKTYGLCATLEALRAATLNADVVRDHEAAMVEGS